MTSKEKLTSLVSALEVIGETTIKKDVVKQYKEDILKDLEILDILKEWLVYDEYEEAVMTYRDIPLDIKEKIMRWLNNEK